MCKIKQIEDVFNREIIFNNFVKILINLYDNNQFNLLFPDTKYEENKYLCPICLKFFSFEFKSGKNSLSDEHIPQESLGGKKTTLICSNCNSNFGSKFDVNLSDCIKNLMFTQHIPNNKNEIKINIRIKNSYSGFTTKLKINENDGEIYAVNKKNKEQKFNDYFKIDINFIEPKDGDRLVYYPYLDAKEILNEKIKNLLKNNISITPVLKNDSKKAMIAMLKNAYLLMFKFFNYGIFNYEIFKFINKILNHSLKHPNWCDEIKNEDFNKFFDSFMIYNNINFNENINLDNEGLYVNLDDEYIMFLISFKLFDKIFTINFPINFIWNYTENNEIINDKLFYPIFVKSNKHENIWNIHNINLDNFNKKIKNISQQTNNNEKI